MRTVKTKSGATAVQVVWASRRGSREIEHLGSAHDEAELEVLKAAARQRVAAGQLELDLALGGGGPSKLNDAGMLGRYIDEPHRPPGSEREEHARGLPPEVKDFFQREVATGNYPLIAGFFGDDDVETSFDEVVEFMSPPDRFDRGLRRVLGVAELQRLLRVGEVDFDLLGEAFDGCRRTEVRSREVPR